MIAPKRKIQPQVLGEQHHEQFLEMLPQIRRQAHLAFRRMRAQYRDDLVQEVIANAFCTFARLVRRGKASLAYASPLANFAIRQVIAGRGVGGTCSILDVTSKHARSVHGIHIESLDTFDKERGDWRAALVEDRSATPADIAAARIDLATWFRRMSCRHRRIAKTLAMGDSTSEAARRFGLSLARVSQIRSLLRKSWEEFQNGGCRCAAQE